MKIVHIGLTIFSFLLIISMPFLPAMTIQHLNRFGMSQSDKTNENIMSYINDYSEFSLTSSFLKRLVAIFEITGSIMFSLWLLNVLELKLIEFAVELKIGVFVTFLLMLLTASIPVKILNGVCLLVQKQLGLGRWKTGFLTLGVLLSWMILHMVQLRRIDYHLIN